MPATKAVSKPTPSKDKVKRKRVEEAADIPTLPTTEDKPAKKSRRDKPSSVSANAVNDSGTSDKASKQKKGTKPLQDDAVLTKETGQLKQKQMETVSPTANTSGKRTSKAKPSSIDANPTTTIAESGSEADPGVAPEPEAEEEVLLEGFSSESDSSDEDMDVGDESPLDISNLPTFSKDDAVVQRKLEKARKHPTEDRGVVYLGRIPHGFYEDQLRAYFTQFGDVTRLRLSRNKKTGQSKHYGFIEFSSSAVADIVSETMDNYLLLGHILKCKTIPKDQVHPELWVGANKKWKMVPRDRVARVKQNKPRTKEEQRRAEAKLLARQKKKESKILALGIDYDFKEVAYQAVKEPVGIVSPT